VFNFWNVNIVLQEKIKNSTLFSILVLIFIEKRINLIDDS